LLSILQAAGWPIIPLLLCSILGLALIVERFLSLRASRVTPPNLVDEVITVTRGSLPSADTLDKLADNSVMGQLLAEGLSAAAADPRISEDKLRLAFEAGGRKAVHQMERYLNALGTIASAAPLLGLLGTLIGMIEIFGSTGGANGVGADPTALAHGISVALYNTAFGLIVAIPALICHRHFRTRIDGYTMDMEEAAERMLQHLMRLPGKRNGA
jgi:biopolymer transport protein ExbB